MLHLHGVMEGSMACVKLMMLSVGNCVTEVPQYVIPTLQSNIQDS